MEQFFHVYYYFIKCITVYLERSTGTSGVEYPITNILTFDGFRRDFCSILPTFRLARLFSAGFVLGLRL